MAESTAIKAPSALPDRHNLFAIASGKGGVGKTWLAISLVHAMAKAGKRALLFDGDFGLANVDVQLGLMPERDLANVLSGEISLEQATLSYAKGGFDILAGRSGSGNLASLDGKKLRLLRNELILLSGKYDQVVVDLGAGISKSVQTFSEDFSKTLVILTDEPTSLVDAYAYIKLRTARQRNPEIEIVVNQAKNVQDGERTFATLRRACENFLSFSPPLAGIIRSDPHVRDSIRAQTPILIRHPSSDAAKDVEALAKKLVEGK